MNENLIAAKYPMVFMEEHSWTDFDAELRRNKFSLPARPRPSVIRVSGDSAVAALREHVRWNGVENTYASTIPPDLLNEFPFLRVDWSVRPEVRLFGWDGWADSIAENAYNTVELDTLLKIPAESSLDAVIVRDLLPESFRTSPEAAGD